MFGHSNLSQNDQQTDSTTLTMDDGKNMEDLLRDTSVPFPSIESRQPTSSPPVTPDTPDTSTQVSSDSGANNPDTSTSGTESTDSTDNSADDTSNSNNSDQSDMSSQQTEATLPATAMTHPDELLDIKQQALQHLTPLVDHLDQSPSERFRTTMMMIQASDNASLIKKAYDTALQITDDKERAQALLDLINEINYFTQNYKDNAPKEA